MPPPPNHRILDHLNPEQRRAAEHFEGPALILAGAGSGKTRVLTTRIAHLVHEHGVPPDRILAVTFTNKAAGEMRERIADLLGGEPRGMWVGTFHALGARILRRHAPHLGWDRAFTILDAEQSLRQIRRTLELLDLDPKRVNPKAVRGLISTAKNQLVDSVRFVEEWGESFDPFARAVARVYPAYQAALRSQNAFDFDDLLVKPVELFGAEPDILESYRKRFSFLLVDEYQDTNRAQFRFLQLLAAAHGNLMVVGDDDQSIYGWRGADLGNILDFESTWPGALVVRLEQNYRSTAVILEAANRVIAENVHRKGKVLRTEREGGEKIVVVECRDENDEAQVIVSEIESRYREGPALHNYRDFAVLYRTNAQSRALEDAFRRTGIPYQIVGGVRFYERREIQDVMGYLRLISNPLDEDAFLRVANYPRRGIGATTLQRLRAAAAARGVGLLEAAAEATTVPGLPTGGARALEGFARLISLWSARAATMRVGALLEALIDEIGLERALADEGPDGEDRIDNVRELIAGALDFDAETIDDLDPEDADLFSELDLFLQRVALVADVDRLDGATDSVTLMTLHNAKGLEFPVVFIAGLEDGLFPLSRAYDDPPMMEEERRLFYVGVTRAEDVLILCHARQRRRAGEVLFGRLSPFVESIPDPLVTHRSATRDPSYRRRPRLADESGARTAADDAHAAAPNPDAPRYVKGERVLHGTFGSGTVQEVTGFGRDTKVTVDFDEVGRKRLLIRYANLERDWIA